MLIHFTKATALQPQEATNVRKIFNEFCTVVSEVLSNIMVHHCVGKSV